MYILLTDLRVTFYNIPTYLGSSRKKVNSNAYIKFIHETRVYMFDILTYTTITLESKPVWIHKTPFIVIVLVFTFPLLFARH